MNNDRMILESWLLQLAFYVYPNKELAEKNEKIGSSGFMASVKSPNGNLYFYAVTNAHVIEQIKNRGVEVCALRFNMTDHSTSILETNIDKWNLHPNGDDLAVYPIEPAKNWKYRSIEDFQMITEEQVYQNQYIQEMHVGRMQDYDNEEWSLSPIQVDRSNDVKVTTIQSTVKVGLGDETFTIGRFMQHGGGKSYNLPAIRFGRISMLPYNTEPIIQSDRDDFPQVSYLVETYSISGFSGSPVLVRPTLIQRTVGRDLTQSVVNHRIDRKEMRLLGIDWGHFGFNGDLVSHDGEGATHIHMPSGMMGVVPAWKLLELLHGKDLTLQRKKLDEQHVLKK